MEQKKKYLNNSSNTKYQAPIAYDPMVTHVVHGGGNLQQRRSRPHDDYAEQLGIKRTLSWDYDGEDKDQVGIMDDHILIPSKYGTMI